MFIYLENLVKTEESMEDIFLIPYPRYVKIDHSNKMKINEDSKLYTDLTAEFHYIIEQLQDSLISYKLKERLEVIKILNYEKNPKIKSFLDENIALFPNSLYNEVTKKNNYQTQGFLMISNDSKIIIKAKSVQGVFYGVQTFIQLLN